MLSWSISTLFRSIETNRLELWSTIRTGELLHVRVFVIQATSLIPLCVWNKTFDPLCGISCLAISGSTSWEDQVVTHTQKQKKHTRKHIIHGNSYYTSSQHTHRHTENNVSNLFLHKLDYLLGKSLSKDRKTPRKYQPQQHSPLSTHSITPKTYMNTKGIRGTLIHPLSFRTRRGKEGLIYFLSSSAALTCPTGK